jgi:hypothetical protein
VGNGPGASSKAGYGQAEQPAAARERVNHLEAGVVDADVYQERVGSEESLEVGQVHELVQAGRDLHAAVVQVPDAEVLPQVAIANGLDGLEAWAAKRGPERHCPAAAEAHDAMAPIALWFLSNSRPG